MSGTSQAPSPAPAPAPVSSCSMCQQCNPCQVCQPQCNPCQPCCQTCSSSTNQSQSQSENTGTDQSGESQCRKRKTPDVRTGFFPDVDLRNEHPSKKCSTTTTSTNTDGSTTTTTTNPDGTQTTSTVDAGGNLTGGTHTGYAEITQRPSSRDINNKPASDTLYNPTPLQEDNLGVLPIDVTSNPAFDVIIDANDEYEDNVDQWFSKPPPPPPPPPPTPVAPGQFTSNYTITTAPTASQMMVDMTAFSQAVPTVSSQDPDGIGWLSPTSWANSTWDGIPYDTTGKTKEQICAFLRPSHVYVIRGLRERFYEVNPFVDNNNPTVDEIDKWNLEVIRHFRNLLGVTTPVSPNARLYLEARWADERKYTTGWDAAYIGATPGDRFGPCVGVPDIAGGHCGASFFPSSVDRAPYIAATPYSSDFGMYPELATYTARYSLTEGISGANANVPWSIKFAYLIANWICSEGLTGHPGPFVGPSAREEFGCSWYRPNSTWASFRGKWH